MRFANREEAAQRLAANLAKYRNCDALVLGIPRGGVVMARTIAAAIGGEVDVVLVHKLGAPAQPEVAIGSVDESGHMYLNDLGRRLEMDDEYIRRECEHQVGELRKKRAMYTPVKEPADPRGRTVIVVDDGLATGATMIAALGSLRQRDPDTLVAATAVSPRETLDDVRALADDVICAHVPDTFFAVGQFFDDFSQVTDDEVLRALRGQ
jgi:predicted phosphoribosyltransferase